jgi:hypothetical protein
VTERDVWISLGILVTAAALAIALVIYLLLL